jgi:NHS family xanthosine MFS transporter
VLKSLGIAHIAGIAIYFATQATNSTEILLSLKLLFYMPTIALNNSVSYAVLNKYSLMSKTFTPSVWGTVGFICMDYRFNGLEIEYKSISFASIAMIITGLLFYFISNVPAENRNSNQTLTSKFV